MSPLDALRSAIAFCPAARGQLPDGLPKEGIANRLRTYGIDPSTLQPGTPEQIAEWRATLGTATGSYAPEQIVLDSIAYRKWEQSMTTQVQPRIARGHQTKPVAQYFQRPDKRWSFRVHNGRRYIYARELLNISEEWPTKEAVTEAITSAGYTKSVPVDPP